MKLKQVIVAIYHFYTSKRFMKFLNKAFQSYFEVNQAKIERNNKILEKRIENDYIYNKFWVLIEYYWYEYYLERDYITEINNKRNQNKELSLNQFLSLYRITELKQGNKSYSYKQLYNVLFFILDSYNIFNIINGKRRYTYKHHILWEIEENYLIESINSIQTKKDIKTDKKRWIELFLKTYLSKPTSSGRDTIEYWQFYHNRRTRLMYYHSMLFEKSVKQSIIQISQ